ncbi:MAG: hypothetical protein GY749_13350 [Desulfobacteraceae bacterium]|nr:hypothetical protein [Desulfobacteraceae bacterium]
MSVPAVSELNTGDIYISYISSGPDRWTKISLVNTIEMARQLTIEFDNGLKSNKF